MSRLSLLHLLGVLRDADRAQRLVEVLDDKTLRCRVRDPRDAEYEDLDDARFVRGED